VKPIPLFNDPGTATSVEFDARVADARHRGDGKKIAESAGRSIPCPYDDHATDSTINALPITDHEIPDIDIELPLVGVKGAALPVLR